MVAIPNRLIAEDSEDVLAELRVSLKARNNAEVIRKSLSLARIAAMHADQDGNIELKGKDGEILLVKLR